MMKNPISMMQDLCIGGAFFFAGMFLFGIDGHAYIDPSVTTYMIQAVAGVVIAVGAGVGMYWRKAKRKVEGSLGIEDSKEQESDEIIVKDEK